MKNGKVRNILIPDTKIYLWIIGILVAILIVYNPIIAVISALVLIYLIYYNWRIVHEKKAQLKEYVENLTINIDAATQKTLLDLPFPFVILEEDANIVWYNPQFLNICEEKELLGEKINNIFDDISIEDILEDKAEKSPIIRSKEGRSYQILSNVIDVSHNKKSKKSIIMMYFLDQTQYVQMKEKYIAERPIIGFIQVDNYDDVIQASADSNRSLIVAAIDRKINLWAKEMDAVIKRFSDDKYFIIFENKHLSLLEKKRFDILDTVRDIQSGNRIPITLSIGIGNTDDYLSPLQSQEEASAALDIALGRGGDQAVVKKKDKLSFYGGKSQAVEKRTKVKARVIAHALKQLIEQADQVFITGHRIPDLDSLGSSLGVYRACRALGKEAYIIFEESNPNIDILYNQLLEKGYEDILLKPEKAKKMANYNTLLIVCDTHRPSFTEEPELIEILDRVVVIDHHRRASEFIEDPILVYLEPYASSTSELVTEILQYIIEKISLEPIEADALLAGIFIDTKNFTFKTGVRTFEAASYLRRKGADTITARQLFQNDMSTFISKAEAVKNSQVYRENIAISISSSDARDATLIAAQTADELLNIHGIVASFVLTKHNDQVFISGRSLGKVNVQVILEKLGGGGHLAVAGAQLLDVDFDQAIGLLKNAIDEYIKEGEDS